MSLIRFGATPEDAGRALVLASGLLHGPSPDARIDRPFGTLFGVCGVGLFAERGRAWPTIFVETPGWSGPLMAGDSSMLNDALALVFPNGPTWLKEDLKIVHVAPCAKHANPADAITVAGMLGRLGTPVHWGTKRGYLTAGHVGQRVGNAVVDAVGARIGSIVYAIDPQPNQNATADIDIALVECDPVVPVNNSLGVSTIATAVSNDPVTVHTQRGALNTTVLGYCKWFAATTSGMTFADVYLSRDGVTVNGDSGGPVLLAGSRSGVIGHIVAGGANTSCFQDIKPQMARVRSDPQFVAIAIQGGQNEGPAGSRIVLRSDLGTARAAVHRAGCRQDRPDMERDKRRQARVRERGSRAREWARS